jgi:hypothetical protein
MRGAYSLREAAAVQLEVRLNDQSRAVGSCEPYRSETSRGRTFLSSLVAGSTSIKQWGNCFHTSDILKGLCLVKIRDNEIPAASGTRPRRDPTSNASASANTILR